MVGRDVQLVVDRGESHPAEARLEVTGLTRPRRPRHARSSGASTSTIRAGEIFGIAGVAGNGQDELVEAIVGLRKPAGGSVVLDGRDVTDATAREMTNLGTGYVPADRHRFGLVLSFTVADNLVLTDYYRAPYARRYRPERRRDRGPRRRRRSRSTTSGPRRRTCSRGRCPAATSRRSSWRASSTATSSCSSSTSRPAASTSAASSSSIARRSRSATPATAVLLVSAELDEVLELSDRVAVMYRGQIVDIVDGRTADRNEVGMLMATGLKHEAAVATGAIAPTDVPDVNAPGPSA